MVFAVRTMALTRRFGSVVAVDGLDLEVPERSVFGFLGRNGAGKTTTIRVLLGLLRPTSGTAALFGVDIARRIEAVRNVGSLIETPPHYDHLTARENLAITARLLRQPKAEIERVLEVVSLASSADRRVGGFSMGMRQRLGVARALLGRPRLLILDEPTNGLDPDGILDMRSLINALPEEQGVTLLISSHILAEVEQTATHLALLDGGRLVTQGSVASLMAGQPRSVSIKARNTGKLLELLDEIGVEGTVHAPDAVQLAPGCADKVAQDIPALNFLMVERGIEVLGLEVREPSLEQFFQREVRRSARERAATSSLPLAA